VSLLKEREERKSEIMVDAGPSEPTAKVSQKNKKQDTEKLAVLMAG
jgi:hypothetical protein